MKPEEIVNLINYVDHSNIKSVSIYYYSTNGVILKCELSGIPIVIDNYVKCYYYSFKKCFNYLTETYNLLDFNIHSILLYFDNSGRVERYEL